MLPANLLERQRCNTVTAVTTFITNMQKQNSIRRSTANMHWYKTTNHGRLANLISQAITTTMIHLTASITDKTNDTGKIPYRWARITNICVMPNHCIASNSTREPSDWQMLCHDPANQHALLHIHYILMFMAVQNKRFVFYSDCSAFSALTLLVGWQEGHPACKNWVVRCWRGYLSGARCRLAYAQLMPLPLTVLPFWYRPTRVVLEKRPLNGCVCVYFTLTVML